MLAGIVVHRQAGPALAARLDPRDVPGVVSGDSSAVELSHTPLCVVLRLRAWRRASRAWRTLGAEQGVAPARAGIREIRHLPRSVPTTGTALARGEDRKDVVE